MDEKNPQATAMGGKSALQNVTRILELGITPTISEDAILNIIEALAKAKAKREGIVKWQTLLNGQDWYVRNLVRFSGLTGQQMQDEEYARAFPDVASENEIVMQLEAMAALIVTTKPIETEVDNAPEDEPVEDEPVEDAVIVITEATA